jgi:serine/threonine-protein kinase HipA
MTLFENEKVLIIERFDLHWTSDGRLLRLPQEDCCQAMSVPPSRKYELDGGPGIIDILRLLNGSDAPIEDQRTFLKATIAFWLLGATDGHAKNFSVRLFEGGRYELTPLYDVVSAQPLVDGGKIRHNKFKLAMAAGKNRHYVVGSITPRHFVESAERAGVGNVVVQSVITEINDHTRGAIEKTIASLPREFPSKLAESIQRGIESRSRLLR